MNEHIMSQTYVTNPPWVTECAYEDVAPALEFLTAP